MSCPGYKHTAEAKLRISASRTGIIPSSESRMKMSLAKKGKPGCARSVITRAKISEARMRRPSRPWSLASKLKMSLTMKGRLPNNWKITGRGRFWNTVPEVAVQGALKEKGLHFLVQSRIPGSFLSHSFDILLPEKKIAVEVDGCFWHGCGCVRGAALKNLDQVRARDLLVDLSADMAGWKIVRLWEHDVMKANFGEVLKCL